MVGVVIVFEAVSPSDMVNGLMQKIVDRVVMSGVVRVGQRKVVNGSKKLIPYRE